MSTHSKPVMPPSAPDHFAIKPRVLLRVSPARLERHLHRYLYPFELALTPCPDAADYLLLLADDRGERYEIRSGEPVVSLSSVWEKLACGFVRANAIARLADGSRVNFGHCFTFFKASPFDPRRALQARVSLERVIDSIFDSLTANDLSDNYDPQSLPLIWHCVVHAERPRLYKKAYPGLHYPNYLDFFLGYARLRPERAPEARKAADQVALKAMEFVTPKEAVWAGLPYSTISQGQMGGDQERGGEIQPLKAAKLGTAMFDYGKATGNIAAVDFALHVGETLARRQHPSGGLPFRIRIDEAESDASESSNLIYAVELWDRLEREKRGRFQKPLKKALDWLLEGPVRRQEWMAAFEDVPSSRAGPGSGNFNHSDASRTARYLLSRREEHPDYLDLAREIDR